MLSLNFFRQEKNTYKGDEARSSVTGHNTSMANAALVYDFAVSVSSKSDFVT